jgi:hypothetical protein
MHNGDLFLALNVLQELVLVGSQRHRLYHRQKVEMVASSPHTFQAVQQFCELLITPEIHKL